MRGSSAIVFLTGMPIEDTGPVAPTITPTVTVGAVAPAAAPAGCATPVSIRYPRAIAAIPRVAPRLCTEELETQAIECLVLLELSPMLDLTYLDQTRLWNQLRDPQRARVEHFLVIGCRDHQR